MVKFSTNEFIAAGHFNDSLYIYKLTSEGKVLWERYFYETGRSLYGAGIDKDEYGNLYVIVWDYVEGSWWQLIKFNASGDSLWSYTVNDTSRAQSVVVNSNSVYVAATKGYWAGKYALYKFSLDGDLLLERSYSVGVNYNVPHDITCDSYGNVILAGEGGAFEDAGYILKCNSNGDTLWSKSLYELRVQSVLTDDEDNILITGWSNRIIKYDSIGNLLFDKTLGDDSWIGYHLIKYDDENVFVIGAKRSGSGTPYVFDIFLGKYSSSSGDSIWTYVYDYPEPTYGATGQDGAVFFDSTIVILSHCFIDLSGWYLDGIFLMMLYLDDTPVPVELKSFTATVNNSGQVVLNWTTATEINNQMFQIERKLVGDNFEKIGHVPGFGTTTEPKSYSFIDEDVSAGTYDYRLKQIDFNGAFEYSNEIEVVVSSPVEFALGQNYPNPFNPTTKIEYSVPATGNVKLTIHNLIGEEVALLVNGQVEAGFYETTFDAFNLPSGMYLYKLQAGNLIEIKKMILVK
jgi:hypothetical protein